jgi:hypothetical protein
MNKFHIQKVLKTSPQVLEAEELRDIAGKRFKETRTNEDWQAWSTATVHAMNAKRSLNNLPLW